jgi:hypothetical protein
MKKSENIAKLAEALCAVQAVLKGAVKDSENPFFHSQYADLTSVWDACRESLTKNGLAVTQPTDVTDSGVIIETVLLHKSGEWIAGRLLLKPTKQDPQGIGSAITYGRRYALAAMVGISPEDDDGEGAMGRETKTEKKKSYPKKAEPSRSAPASDAPPTHTTAKDKLKKELHEYCNGDEAVMDEVLKNISIFGSPGDERWIRDINKSSEKWCAKSLGNLRKLAEDMNQYHSPADEPADIDDIPF